MKVLVYGAGVIGSLLAARLHEAGHDASLLARGERLAALRENGVLLAESGSPIIRQAPVPVVERPAGPYDLITILVRTHQVDAALESIIGHDGDVLFMLNWAAGPEPLGAVIGEKRVLLGFPSIAGNMDGEVVRYRATSLLTHMVSMPIGEPSGIVTPRLERIVQTFRSAGINAKAELRIDAWLKTHAAFEVPLGQAVRAVARFHMRPSAKPYVAGARRHRQRQSLPLGDYDSGVTANSRSIRIGVNFQ
jgi:2-dehydropantoate 2-reductase